MNKILSILSLGLLVGINAIGQQTNTLLWEIKSPQGKVSHVFGTYHLFGPAYLKTRPKVKEAFEKAKTVVVETVVDSSKMQALAMQGSMAPKSLRQMLDSTEYSLVREEFLKKTGMDIIMFDSFKPMYAMANYSMSLAIKEMGDDYVPAKATIDMALAILGKKMGKKVVGLESMEEQMAILFDYATPEEQAVELVQLIKDSVETKEMTKKLLATYKAEDLNGMLALSLQEQSMALDMSVLLEERNKNWIAPLMKLLDEGDVFIAVGALHLPGESGVLALLKREGYAISPIQQ